MVAKGRTRGKGGTSKNSAAPTAELGERAAVTEQAENSDVVTKEEAEVAEGAADLEGTEVDEGEMEGVEGDGGENASFEESGDMEQSIQPGEDDVHDEDGGEFGGEELIGEGADDPDDGAAVDIDEENEEGVSDISWVEELWNKKKAEEAEAENAPTAEEEQVADDVDFEMEDESKERLDSTQKEQAEDVSNEKKTVATADQGETEEGTTGSLTKKWSFPKSLHPQTMRHACIPRAYFGPAFDESCFQCCVRIYPVSYVDMVRPDFTSILQSVDCVRMALGPRPAPRCLELFCRKSMPIVHNLMFSAHSSNSVTIEINRRKPIGWKEVTQNETTVSVPTAFSLEECTKAKFTLKTAYFRQNLCKLTPVNAYQSVKERSLFINNVKNKERGILKHIFPLASKIALVKVSEDLSSAVLTMKCRAMVLDHLVAVTDVSINGLKLEMGAVNMTQEAAQKLIDKPHSRKLSEKSRERTASSSGPGADDGQKARTGPGGDQEKKDKERKSRELKEKEKLDREKKDREQKDRMQRERDRERERGQKNRLERERSGKYAEEERVKARKRELARKEFSRAEKNTRREPDRSLRTGRQETRGRQRSGGLWGHPGGQMRHEMGMRHEMNIQREREMQREMERELEREMEIEREMRRQREMQRELEVQMERERREREEWEWQDMERRKMEAQQEEERERRHQEELLREKEKLEKMHQDAVLKLMMVEEQQRRERDELKRREHEMEMEKKHMQQQLEEERRRQQQEKEEWERTSRKRGRYEEPEAVGPRHGGMANKRGRGSEGPWQNFYVSGDGSDQPQSQRPSGKHISPAAGSSSEVAAKHELELEVARQAEELKKSLALLDKIQKVPMGASATFGEVHGGTEKGDRDQQPDPQQLYAEDFRPQNQQRYNEDYEPPQYNYNHGQDYNAQYQDYGRDASHFQYSHGGGQETVTGDSYSNQYGGGDHTGHQSTSTWGAGAAEGASWRPQADKETGGYSQPARQWRNTQRQGQSRGGQGGQSRGGQGGRQRRGQEGRQGSSPGQQRQMKAGVYQQSAWQGADSNYAAKDMGYEGGGYASYGQQKHQGGGGYNQDRWSSGGGRHGGQGIAGNY